MTTKYLFVAPRPISIPPAAGTTRPYELLSRLGKRAEVHGLFVHPNDDAAWSAMADHPKCKAVFSSVDFARPSRRPGLLPRVLNPLTLRPFFDNRFKDPALLGSMRRKVTEWVSAHGPAKLYLYSHVVFQYVPARYWKATLLDSVDAVSLLQQRRLKTDAAMTAFDRFTTRLSLPIARRYERATYRRVGAVTLNSSLDVEYLKSHCPEATIRRVPDGCDFAYFGERMSGLTESDNELALVGHMGYPPNADAARHLLAAIMPLIWKRRPDVKVTVIGPCPPASVQALHDGKRVEVTGFVEDVRPYIQRAALVVSPVRYGTGMKNKLQTGLAAGKAMVVSTVTCEGFDRLVPGTHAVVADGPRRFAEAVCDLLADPQRRRRLGQEGQRMIREHYSWEAAVEALVAAFEHCTVAGPG